MLEGQLFYDEDKDKWTLKTVTDDKKVNSLIYGLAELGFEFEGNGESVSICVHGHN